MTDAPEEKPDPLEKSLGDQATGADVSRTDKERSLGDEATGADALSSISDVSGGLGEAIDSALPVIDLAARYEIEGELGQGGMGAVRLATDRQLKRKVAIKRILGPMAQSKTALQRFVTEAQSIAALNHFNIVQVHEFGRDAEGPLLVLEYVDGGSLLDKLSGGKLETEEAVDITCQLCDGLAVAHEQGIIHRDIKPANILLTRRGAPKLTDFGLARQETADHGQTQAGAVLGTIDFMPPEQRRDATEADARSDLWSLAATLYQMLTGKSPKVIRLDQLPANLAPVIGKMLEDDPKDRYEDARTFKQELQSASSCQVVEMSEYHTHDEFEIAWDYRPVSIVSVVSLGLGLLSFAALVFKLFWVIPAAAVLLAIIALRRVGRSDSRFTGRGFAVAGLLLGLLFGSMAPAHHYLRKFIVNQQSKKFVEIWLKMVEDGSLQKAHQLTRDPKNRIFMDSKDRLVANKILKEKYRNNVDRWKEQLETDFGEEPMKTLVARKDWETCTWVANLDQSRDRQMITIRQLYRVRFRGTGLPRFVDLELTVTCQYDKAARETYWTIAGVQEAS